MAASCSAYRVESNEFISATTFALTFRGREYPHVDTDYSFGVGFRGRWGLLRPQPLGLWRRCGHRAGSYIVDPPRGLHVGGLPLRQTPPSRYCTRANPYLWPET